MADGRCETMVACTSGDVLIVDPIDAFSPCNFQPEAGPCTDFSERFFFDVETKECRTFQYGGCDGNSNKFETREECELTCRTP
jgi:hypothetical protein